MFFGFLNVVLTTESLLLLLLLLSGLSVVVLLLRGSRGSGGAGTRAGREKSAKNTHQSIVNVNILLNVKEFPIVLVFLVFFRGETRENHKSFAARSNRLSTLLLLFAAHA